MASKIRGIVIGGSGLVGGAIIFHFHNNCEAIDVKAPNSKKLDLRSTTDIYNYFELEKADFIVNTAIASLGHGAEGTYKINYLGTINLAKVALALKIPLIHISSSAVLRPGVDIREHERLELTADLSDYAKSKLMSELTLEYLGRQYGLDYSIVRLGIVYGKRDYKIKGFHRLLFSVASGTLPVLLTRKKVAHSYTNLRKVPSFVEHIVHHREEFRGKSINFVDREPVELSTLFLTLRQLMNRKRPHNLHLPLPMAKACIALVDHIKGIMAKIGVETTMPAELSFLESMYSCQTLNTDLLEQSSYNDPYPDYTFMSELPTIIDYYLKRWNELGMLGKQHKSIPEQLHSPSDYFITNPAKLIDQIHMGMQHPLDTCDDLLESAATGSIKESRENMAAPFIREA
jgi:nucleoside-diphosphate-sugar epimerase